MGTGVCIVEQTIIEGQNWCTRSKAEAAALVDPSGKILVTVLAMAPLFELVLLLMLGEPMLPPGKLGPINPPVIGSKGTKSGKASNTAAAAKAFDDAEELEEDADDAVAADDDAAADADAAALLDEKDDEEEDEAAEALPVDDVPELDEAVDAILIMTFKHVSAVPNIRQRL